METKKEIVLPEKIMKYIDSAKNQQLKKGLLEYHLNKFIKKEEEKERKRKQREKKKEHEKEIKKRKRLRKRATEKRRKEKKEKEKKEKEKKEREKKKASIKKKLKKHVGRPKKRGPQKKYWRHRKKKVCKKRGRKKLSEFSYKIISCKNGRQNKLIGKYRTSEEAYDMFKKLKEEDAKVVFPVMFYGYDILKQSIDEYILIEKDDSDTEVALPNEYGIMVKHKTNKDGWKIIDKIRYHKEETFWVWGYNNKNDRKTFIWVYDNLVKNKYSFLEIKRIYTYKNKLIIKDDNDSINIVFCKSQYDSVLFYNMLQKFVKKDKLKNVVFTGDFSHKCELKKKIEDEIMELTGFSRAKVQMRGNSYFMIENKKIKEN